MFTQNKLHKLFSQSLAKRGYESLDQALAVLPSMASTVILNDLDLVCYCQNVLKFSLLLPSTIKAAWYRQFTKSVFFFGNPQRLPDHFQHTVTVSCKNMAICGPFYSPNKGLNMLFKLVSTSGSFVPSNVQIQVPSLFAKPTHTGRKTLFLDSIGLSLERYLVHLTHSLCESIITKGLLPGDRLNIIHTPNIPETNAIYTRINFVEDGSSRLKLFSLLTNS